MTMAVDTDLLLEEIKDTLRRMEILLEKILKATK
jgi:hypothetical protein